MALGERLFAARVEILGLLQPGFDFVHDVPRDDHLYEGVREHLQREVVGMPLENFIVRSKRRWVEKFQDQKAWEQLSEEDSHELTEHVAGLPTTETDTDVDAKRFDLLCLRIQLAMLRKASFEPLRKALITQVHQLEAKETIPDVKREMELILEVQTADWWADANVSMIEDVRRRLRGLMSLIDPKSLVIINTNLVDSMGEKREVELIDLGGASSLAQFRRKARAWIEAHADNLTLVRLRKGRPITSSDLGELQSLLIDAGITNGEQFEQLTKMPNLPVFIRSLVGLDRKEAMQAFNDALAEYTLSASQIAFVELIVDQLTASGRLDPALLYDPPFTDRNPNGVSDLFQDSQVAKIVETIRGFEPHLEAG